MLRVTPLVAPLAMNSILFGGALVHTGGAPHGTVSPEFIFFGQGHLVGLPRTECLASIKKEAGQQRDLADLIVLDGQGDIAKQVNDIESLISQNVDAILCIANSGSAVAPVLRDATKQGIVTVPFNLPVNGEAWTA